MKKIILIGIIILSLFLSCDLGKKDVNNNIRITFSKTENSPSGSSSINKSYNIPNRSSEYLGEPELKGYINSLNMKSIFIRVMQYSPGFEGDCGAPPVKDWAFYPVIDRGTSYVIEEGKEITFIRDFNNTDLRFFKEKYDDFRIDLIEISMYNFNFNNDIYSYILIQEFEDEGLYSYYPSYPSIDYTKYTIYIVNDEWLSEKMLVKKNDIIDRIVPVHNRLREAIILSNNEVQTDLGDVLILIPYKVVKARLTTDGSGQEDLYGKIYFDLSNIDIMSKDTNFNFNKIYIKKDTNFKISCSF